MFDISLNDDVSKVSLRSLVQWLVSENWPKGAQTVPIWLSKPVWLIGNTFCRILNVLILLIAFSTCILTFAISWVSFTWSSVNWPWLLRKGGIFKVHPRGSRRSFITKPLSAITLSPLSSNERIPDCLVISLSDMPPVYNWDTKVTLPEGAIYTQQCFSCSGTFVLWENLRLPQKRGRCLDLEFSGIKGHPCWRKFPKAIGHCFLNYMFRQPEIDRSATQNEANWSMMWIPLKLWN